MACHNHPLGDGRGTTKGVRCATAGTTHEDKVWTANWHTAHVRRSTPSSHQPFTRKSAHRNARLHTRSTRSWTTTGHLARLS